MWTRIRAWSPSGWSNNILTNKWERMFTGEGGPTLLVESASGRPMGGTAVSQNKKNKDNKLLSCNPFYTLAPSFNGAANRRPDVTPEGSSSFRPKYHEWVYKQINWPSFEIINLVSMCPNK